MGYKKDSNNELVLNSTVNLVKDSENYAEVMGGYKLFNDNSIKIESGKMIGAK